MERTRIQRSYNSVYTAPSKVFILGEYLALAQGPSLVAAISPRFCLQLSEIGEASTSFHPQSPVGRLLDRAGKADFRFHFEDPHAQMGGFGASTAQFALAYLALAPAMKWDQDWSSVWTLYRELMGDQPIPPSGADLVSQWQGGALLFSPKAGCADLSSKFPGSRFLLFSAAGIPGRKVATHTHLGSLAGEARLDHSLIFKLEAILGKGVAAIESGNAPELGVALDHYAETLCEAGLEVPATREDRSALRHLPGVLGVKGTGALQSDAILVLMDSDVSGTVGVPRNEVIRIAESRGLRLVANALKPESGVECRQE